jgi:hypothetical protein
LQHPAQPVTTDSTASSKRGFDLIVAATVSDDLAGGIDCLIRARTAQYEQLERALHLLRLCRSGLDVSSDLI